MNRLVILLLLITSGAQARTMELLKCLGAEEKSLHLKKDTGPIYELNQRLISELVQIPDALIKREYYSEICHGPDRPSWKLLRLSIIKGKELFELPPGRSKMQRLMTEGMIEEYLEATKEILLGLISQIQTLAPTPDCLKEEIPQIERLFTKIKYLQGEVELKALFEKHDKKILSQLKYYPEAFQRCRERARKKPKSGSTADKKP